MNLTENKIERVAKDWRKIAVLTIEVRQIGSAIYAFGGELATLKLLKNYRYSKDATQGYSENMGTYFFCLELS